MQRSVLKYVEWLGHLASVAEPNSKLICAADVLYGPSRCHPCIAAFTHQAHTDRHSWILVLVDSTADSGAKTYIERTIYNAFWRPAEISAENLKVILGDPIVRICSRNRSVRGSRFGRILLSFGRPQRFGRIGQHYF